MEVPSEQERGLSLSPRKTGKRKQENEKAEIKICIR